MTDGTLGLAPPINTNSGIMIPGSASNSCQIQHSDPALVVRWVELLLLSAYVRPAALYGPLKTTGGYATLFAHSC